MPAQKRLAGWLHGLAVLALACAAGAAAPSVTPPSSTPASPPASGEVVFLKSKFDDTLVHGKDPFFPKSTRPIQGKSAALLFEDFPELVLKGISTGAGKRLALISGRTLAPGEEGEFRVGKRSYLIRCTEIREISVVLSYRNQTKEVFLRQGLQ